MRASDIKAENWAEIRGRLAGDRLATHEQLLAQGRPMTARELAAAMGRDLLCVAPRLTELCQMGLVRCVGREGKRGLYEAVALREAEAAFHRSRARVGEQMVLL